MIGSKNSINNYTGLSDNETERQDWSQKEKILILKFVIFYLISVCFAVLVWRSADAGTEVVNVISISAGILSIGLAFVAIIYAFYQSKMAAEQNTQMQIYLRRIGDQVDALGGISAEIAQFKTVFDHRMDGIKILQQELTQGNEKVNKSISSISDLLVKIKPGNEEVIEKVKEEFKQLKLVNEQKNTKVSENLDNIVSNSIMGSVTVRNPTKVYGGYVPAGVLTSTRKLLITLTADGEKWNNELSGKICSNIKNILKEKLKTHVELQVKPENISEDLVLLNVEVTMPNEIQRRIDIESLITQILEENYKFVVLK